MRRYFRPEYLAIASASVLTVGLSTGKGLLSVCTVALAFSALWYSVEERKFRIRAGEQWTMWWMIGLFLVSLMSGIWTEDRDRWLIDVYEKIPLLLIPPAVALLPRFSKWEWRWIKFIFLATQSVVAVWTLIRFTLTYREQMQRVAENSFIDIVGSISHIYFGLLLGWSVVIGIHLYRDIQEEKPAWLKFVIIALTIVNSISIHILVSRTGLLAFYAGIIAYGAIMLWQSGRKWLIAGLVGAAVLGPVVAYYTIPSFQTRVRVTIWDAEQYYYQADLTDNSLSLRFLAWEATWGIITEHPVLGTGMEDVGADMLDQYKKQGLDDRGENLLTNPHNQFLKQWAGAGIPGLLILVMAVVQPVWDHRQKFPPLVFAFMMTMAITMMFESLLERQIGMTTFAVFGMWVIANSGQEEP